MKKFYNLFRPLLVVLLLGAGFGLQAQTISLGIPNVGDCTPDGNTPTSTITVDVSWDISAGDVLEVELLGGSVISTNPVLFNASTAGSNQQVSFTVLADGTEDVEISARYRTPNTSTTNGTQTTAQFDIAANTCTGGSATICTDGTNDVTFTPALDPTDANDAFTNVQWFAISQDGLTTTLIADDNYDGNDGITVTYNGDLLDDNGAVIGTWSDLFYENGAGDPEARFYFTATDENGCTGELCVPITVNAEVCYDLALTKTVSTVEPDLMFVPGDDVTFTFTVTNQGTRTAYDIDVTDYFPAGLTNPTLVVNPDVSQPGGVGTDLFRITSLDGSDDGATAGDREVSFDVTFTIPSTYMDPTITNAAEISQFFKEEAPASGPDNRVPADDEDSTPDNNNNENTQDELDNFNDRITDVDDNSPQDNDGAEDDYDPELINITQTFDLALRKREVSSGPYIPGNPAADDVTFSIEVFNQGTLDATSFTVTDYIPTGLTFVDVDETNAAFTQGTPGSVSDDGNGVFTVTGLDAGESVIVDISFQIVETFTDETLINYAEITASTNALDVPDADSPVGTINEGDDESGPGVDDKILDEDGSLQDDDPDSDDYDGASIEVVQQVALGNIVFSDVDGDGVFDAGDGDAGISGVTVELYAAADAANIGTTAIAVTSVTTDAGGFYLFDNLDPGDYIVYIPGGNFDDNTGPLDNTLSSIPDIATENTDDDNADENGQNTLVNGGVISAVFNLQLNNEPTGEDASGAQIYGGADPLYLTDLDDNNVNLTADFAFTPEYRIGNLVWEDVDNDGIAEDGEPGIDGVVVNLYQDDGDGILEVGTDDTFIGTTTTAAGGKYEFTGLYQGDYIVVIPDAGAPGQAGTGNNLLDYFSSTTDDSDPNSLTDLTGDDNNDNGANSVTTATNGIEGLASAVITLGTGDSEPIDEQLRSDDPTNDDTDGMAGTVPDNRSNVTVDFGFYQKLSLGDLVFFDTNNDGIFDADGVDAGDAIDDEYGFAGVEVRLLDGTGAPVDDPNQVGTQNYVLITDANGNYLFEGLDPGDYIVELVTPGGYKSSTGLDGPTGTYEAAPDPDNGDLFDDVNNDDNGSEVTATTIRSLPITLTSNGEPTNDGDADPNTNLSLDFGIVGYSLGNYVWLDDDNSGNVNGAEAGINGVTVRLLNDDDSEYDTDPNTAGIQPFDVTTADGGFYFFGNLPAGDYKVLVLGSNFTTSSALDNLIPSTGAAEEDNPNVDGDQNDNGLGDLPSVTDLTTNGVTSGVVTLGEGNGFAEPAGEATTLSGNAGEDPNSNSDRLSNLTVDFGFTPSVSVGSTVFADVDNNGMLDGGETGIDGVTVQLYDADNDMLVATDVTSGGGNYYFEGLPEGDYYIVLPNVGTELATTPKSSEPTVDDPDLAGDVDGDDNGIQTNAGDAVSSGVFTLQANTEPVDGAGANDESGLGSAQDADDDNNGNMAIDFGFYQPVDYGDLADLGDGTGTGDYETASATGGPSHIIVAGLQIGATVDDELDGQQSANADGDDSDSSGDDEDGVDIAAQTYKAGNTVNIPITVTNTTGGVANLYAFVDWNGDGDFNDLGEAELVTVPNVAGEQTILVEFVIPTDAQGAAINSPTPVGARFRLTTDDLGAVNADGTGADAASQGAATDGEVEDYILDITCPTGNCFGVTIEVQDKN